MATMHKFVVQREAEKGGGHVMAFEPIRDGRGQPRVRCICDECGRDEVVAAVHGRDGSEGQGQAVSKVQKLGWSFIGKRLRCSSCESSRKVVKMADKKAAKVAVEPPREPTRAQKREIMDLLDEVYDVDAECYKRGDTDETVADVLGVMPGWVSQLREEFFGPAGGNQDMEELAKRLDAVQLKLDGALLEAQQACQVVAGLKDEVSELLKALGAIRKAVGPRVLARAKQ